MIYYMIQLLSLSFCKLFLYIFKEYRVVNKVTINGQMAVLLNTRASLINNLSNRFESNAQQMGRMAL